MKNAYMREEEDESNREAKRSQAKRMKAMLRQ